MIETGVHIGGETRPGGGGDLALTEPATGEPLATVSLAGEADVDAAVAAAGAALQRRLGPRAGDRAVAPPARARRRDPGGQVGAGPLEAQNVGKAISSVNAELAAAVETFRFYAAVAAAPTGRTGRSAAR